MTFGQREKKHEIEKNIHSMFKNDNQKKDKELSGSLVIRRIRFWQGVGGPNSTYPYTHMHAQAGIVFVLWLLLLFSVFFLWYSFTFFLSSLFLCNASLSFAVSVLVLYWHVTCPSDCFSPGMMSPFVDFVFAVLHFPVSVSHPLGPQPCPSPNYYLSLLSRCGNLIQLSSLERINHILCNGRWKLHSSIADREMHQWEWSL